MDIETFLIEFSRSMSDNALRHTHDAIKHRQNGIGDHVVYSHVISAHVCGAISQSVLDAVKSCRAESPDGTSPTDG